MPIVLSASHTNILLCFSYINATQWIFVATCVRTIISRTTSAPVHMVYCVYRRILTLTMCLNYCTQAQHTGQFVLRTEGHLDVCCGHSAMRLSRNTVNISRCNKRSDLHTLQNVCNLDYNHINVLLLECKAM